jgi:hypothetical protein
LTKLEFGQRCHCWTVQGSTDRRKLRTVARTIPALLKRIPMDDTAHMRAACRETAVEVATASLKSIRTLVERESDDVVNQAQQSHSEHLLKDLKKLNKQQAAVRKELDKS